MANVVVLVMDRWADGPLKKQSQHSRFFTFFFFLCSNSPPTFPKETYLLHNHRNHNPLSLWSKDIRDSYTLLFDTFVDSPFSWFNTPSPPLPINSGLAIPKTMTQSPKNESMAIDLTRSRSQSPIPEGREGPVLPVNLHCQVEWRIKLN